MFAKKMLVILVSGSMSFYSAFSFATDDNTQDSTPKKTTESTRQYISDADITAKVKMDFLKDSDISSLHISVKTDKRVVRLTGHVESEEQKMKAGEIAKNVEGVKSVKNHLTIKK